MTVPFNKPPTSIPEQIALLRERGLIISETSSVEHYLRHIGYYRLAGYWRFYQTDPVKHLFIDGASFEDVIAMYNFDRNLRLLIMGAIESIEVSFRTVMVNVMCAKYGPTWYANKRYAFSENVFDKIVKDIGRELARSNENFVVHHDKKYGHETHPPAWKTVQVLSFGTLSKLYGNICNDIPERKEIAQIYGLPSEAWLHSWMQVISVLRNCCAHHSRLCFRTFSFPPKNMHRPKLPWIKNIPRSDGIQSQQLYYQLCAVRYLLHTCDPATVFNEKLAELVAKYPKIDLARMGFLPGWEKEDLWKLANS